MKTLDAKQDRMNSMKIVSDEKNRCGKPYFSGPAFFFFFLRLKYSGSALRVNGLIVFVGFIN